MIVIRMLFHPLFKPRQGYLQPSTCSQCSDKLVYLILDALKYFACRDNSRIFIIMLDFYVILMGLGFNLLHYSLYEKGVYG